MKELIATVESQGYSSWYLIQKFPVVGGLASVPVVLISAGEGLENLFKAAASWCRGDREWEGHLNSARKVGIIFSNSLLNVVTLGIFNSAITWGYSIDWDPKRVDLAAIAISESSNLPLTLNSSIREQCKPSTPEQEGPSGIAEADKVEPIFDRNAMKKLIVDTVLDCDVEDRLGVCSILFSKFECTQEEKTKVVRGILYYAKGDLDKDTQIGLESLRDLPIPKYSEAPPKIQKQADQFLAAAVQVSGKRTTSFSS